MWDAMINSDSEEMFHVELPLFTALISLSLHV
jgi:hypothetical protein